MAAAEPSTRRAGLETGAGLPTVPARPAWSDRLPRAWLFPLMVFAATWLLILAAWDGSDAIFGHSHSWTWHFLFKDANFYLSIAEHGYTGDPYKAAFFPVFPLLIRVASYLTGGNYAVAGLIVSVVCGAASAVGVWALAARVCDRWVADRAVMLYCVFPGAMAFGMLYSEPLSVAIAAAALLALLDRRWLLAGIIGAVGTAERPTLIFLAVVSGVAAMQAIWTRREWRALLAPALTPLGILAYFGYLGHRYHSYTHWFQLEQSGWNQHFDWGAHTVRVLLWLDPKNGRHPVFVVVLTVMLAAAVAGIALMIAARLPLPVMLFGILTILLSITSSAGGARPRFILAAFPVFIGAAAKLPRAVYWPVLVLSAAGLVFLLGGWPYHLIGLKTAP
jgi:dolichyl-phosphate-mannose-protein mannosyltransferase